MLRGEFPEAGDTSTADLEAAYRRLLAETVDAVGLKVVRERSGLPSSTVEAVAAGESEPLTLTDAAAILAADPERPDAETLAAEARDILLLGMTTAVLDVESLASELDDALEPKEIQQMVEGRHPMTLAEYALVHHHIERRTR
jgi:hypothetical protein